MTTARRVLPAGRRKRIHMNGAVIRRNKKLGLRDAAITVKTYRTNDYAHRAVVCCPGCGAAVVELKTDFDRPLPSGAVAWMETTGAVTLLPAAGRDGGG